MRPTHYTRDLITIVYSQMPRQVADKVTVDVECDPYILNAIVIVKRGLQTWKARLEPQEVNGVMINVKVPDEFLAFLCVSV
jgi:hypothetical protein